MSCLILSVLKRLPQIVIWTYYYMLCMDFYKKQKQYNLVGIFIRNQDLHTILAANREKVVSRIYNTNAKQTLRRKSANSCQYDFFLCLRLTRTFYNSYFSWCFYACLFRIPTFKPQIVVFIHQELNRQLLVEFVELAIFSSIIFCDGDLQFVVRSCLVQ